MEVTVIEWYLCFSLHINFHIRFHTHIQLVNKKTGWGRKNAQLKHWQHVDKHWKGFYTHTRSPSAPHLTPLHMSQHMHIISATQSTSRHATVPQDKHELAWSHVTSACIRTLHGHTEFRFTVKICFFGVARRGWDQWPAHLLLRKWKETRAGPGETQTYSRSRREVGISVTHCLQLEQLCWVEMTKRGLNYVCFPLRQR